MDNNALYVLSLFDDISSGMVALQALPYEYTRVFIFPVVEAVLSALPALSQENFLPFEPEVPAAGDTLAQL